MSGRTPDEGRYSKVSRRMWWDEKFQKLSKAKPNGQTLWERLLTGPELGCIPGLFPARLGGLADALGWALKPTKDCWQEISDQDMAEADWAAGLVWVPNAIIHNEPNSINTVLGWRMAFKELPECALKQKAVEALREYMAAKGEAWARAFETATSEPRPKPKAMPSPKPKSSPSETPSDKPSCTQEQEQEQESGTRSPAPERVVDSDRETICPLDLTDQAEAVGIFPELSRHLGVTEVSLREEARQFVAYWVIGKGMGKKRPHWMARLRQRLVDRASEGRLPKSSASGEVHYYDPS